VSFFARLLGIAPAPQPQTPLAAGVVALEQRRFADALRLFAAALAACTSATERAVVQNKRALTYLRAGDLPAAVDAWCDALADDARCVSVIVNLGNVLLEAGVLDDAIAHYEAAVRIDDAYAPAHLNVGIAYKRLGRHADAVRAFRRANRLEAGSPQRRRA
jgi:tetratricopeptide (TPR) repeat protein